MSLNKLQHIFLKSSWEGDFSMINQRLVASSSCSANSHDSCFQRLTNPRRIPEVHVERVSGAPAAEPLPEIFSGKSRLLRAIMLGLTAQTTATLVAFGFWILHILRGGVR